MTNFALLAKHVWMLALALSGLPLATTSPPRPSVFPGPPKTTANPIAPVEDHFTPHAAPVKWYALGDSYTAAPGTGADFDKDEACLRNNGAYALQMQSSFPFKESNNMTFLACVGYTAPDTLSKTLPLMEKDRADFVAMTLGGNDIGFSKLATECLIKPAFLHGSCSTTLEKARLALKADKLEKDIHAVYDKIFENMKDDRHYQLYHIFYHRFFNDQTEWCSHKSFGLATPSLTREVRTNMNVLADELNQRLQDIAEKYIQKQSGKSWSQGSRLFTINPDKLQNDKGETYGLFDGHRFCEPEIKDLTDPRIWFFGLLDTDSLQKREMQVETLEQFDTDECNRDPKYSSDAKFSYECDVARHFAKNGGVEKARLFQVPEVVRQTFHPKSVGHEAIKRILGKSLQEHRPAEKK